MPATTALCHMAHTQPSSSPVLTAPDLLRLESFGGMYYSRQTCKFHALPPHHTRLLVNACRESILDVYARNPAATGYTDQQFVELVVRWQQAGWLDRNFRCNARVIPRTSPPGVLSGPLVTHLQLTHGCNLRCTHCYVSITPKPAPDELTTEMLLRLFSDLHDLGSPVLIVAGGEPMIRRDFWTLTDALSQYEIDAWLCTNATLIHREEAERLAQSAFRGISVSLDGPNASIHDSIRGNKRFDHACRGIKNLVDAGSSDVTIRVTVSSENVDSLLDFAPLATELGVSKIVFKAFRKTGEASNQHHLEVERSRYLEAVKIASEQWPPNACPAEFGDGIPNRPPDWTRIIPAFGCVGGTVSVTVNAKGRVVGCGPVESNDDWFLQKHSFRDCWQKAPSIQRWRELEGNDSCFGCLKFKVCGGGCRARALAVGRGMNGTDPWSFCAE